jgi:hypothetical protein
LRRVHSIRRVTTTWKIFNLGVKKYRCDVPPALASRRGVLIVYAREASHCAEDLYSNMSKSNKESKNHFEGMLL